jgi:hypothetical protein
MKSTLLIAKLRLTEMPSELLLHGPNWNPFFGWRPCHPASSEGTQSFRTFSDGPSFHDEPEVESA